MAEPVPKTPNTKGEEPSWYNKSDKNKNVPSSPSVENRSSHSNWDKGISATSKDLGATGENSNHDKMIKTVVRLGKDSYTIKDYISCKGHELFALECERSITGYDGRCPGCGGQHLQLAKLRGYYAPINNIYDAIANQNVEKERLRGRKKPEKLKRIEGNLPPLTHEITGINKGIEGDSNSCYMDSTIFCMFAYSKVFDSLLNMDVQGNDSLAKLQKLLKENIVNVLRSGDGFVERDALFNLRVLLSEATNDQSFQQVEKDPSEFLRALEGLFHYTPLKTIPTNQLPNDDESNITKNIIWEMFDSNTEKLLSTKIASIFRNSLVEIKAKLATIPPVLILMAPRHARSQRSYRYIIPDREITLDNEMVQLVCLKCEQTNHDSNQPIDFFFCNECYSKKPPSSPIPSTDANIICYCLRCLTELHRDLPENIRYKHDLKKLKNITKLKLFAVLCIETSHYVAFVKCHKSNQKDQWMFFDSMSDRIHNEINVPCVSSVADFDQWIQEAEDNTYYFEELDKRRSQGKPTSQVFNEFEMRRLRLFRDGAFFFYENSLADYQ